MIILEDEREDYSESNTHPSKVKKVFFWLRFQIKVKVGFLMKMMTLKWVIKKNKDKVQIWIILKKDKLMNKLNLVLYMKKFFF